MAAADVRVDVAYARPDQQAVVELQLPAGADVATAIERSGLLARFPEIDLRVHAVGVFGKKVSLDRTLSDGDRVEIYRALVADPKEVRRRRAARRRR